MTPTETSSPQEEINGLALSDAREAAQRRLGVAMPFMELPPMPDDPEKAERARSAAGNAMMWVAIGLYGKPAAIDMNNPKSVKKFMEMNTNLGVAAQCFSGDNPKPFVGGFAPALEAAASTLRGGIAEQLSPEDMMNVAELDASLEHRDSLIGPAIYFAATAYQAIWEQEAHDEQGAHWTDTSAGPSDDATLNA